MSQETSLLTDVFWEGGIPEDVSTLFYLINGVFCLFVVEAVRRPTVVSVTIPLRLEVSSRRIRCCADATGRAWVGWADASAACFRDDRTWRNPSVSPMAASRRTPGLPGRPLDLGRWCTFRQTDHRALGRQFTHSDARRPQLDPLPAAAPRLAVCEAVNALPAAALAKAGVSAVVATATALGPSAGRCASIAANVFGVDS